MILWLSVYGFRLHVWDLKTFPMSARFGSVLDNTTTPPPQIINILRDIDASRVLFEGELSLAEDTSVCASILLLGIETNCVNISSVFI